MGILPMIVFAEFDSLEVWNAQFLNGQLNRVMETMEITARIEWHRRDAAFTDNRYSRAHAWRFDGGAQVPASASPAIVPWPMSDAAAVDPEEAFVAALSSCHMLCFLSVTARAGFIVDRYTDDAAGEMRRNADGKLFVAEVILRPRIEWSAAHQPSESRLMELHESAHQECFIASSVKTDVRIQPAT